MTTIINENQIDEAKEARIDQLKKLGLQAIHTQIAEYTEISQFVRDLRDNEELIIYAATCRKSVVFFLRFRSTLLHKDLLNKQLDSAALSADQAIEVLHAVVDLIDKALALIDSMDDMPTGDIRNTLNGLREEAEDAIIELAEPDNEQAHAVTVEQRVGAAKAIADKVGAQVQKLEQIKRINRDELVHQI